MKHEYYERKINDVIMKCPIEAGVEILVYNVLDDIVHSKGLVLVDINRLRKGQDFRLTTDGGVSDIAILSSDFEFGTDKGQVHGFIEVKATNKKLIKTNQVKGQMSQSEHYLYTNGLVWKYYNKKELKWTICLAKSNCLFLNYAEKVLISKEEFERLIENLERINWEK